MILFLTSDLMFQSRVASAATSLGRKLLCGNSLEKLLDRILEQEVIELFVIDLTTPRLDLEATWNTIQARFPGLRVIAFGPHVHVELLKQARSLGCEVLTRGQFDQSYRDLLMASEAGEGL